MKPSHTISKLGILMIVCLCLLCLTILGAGARARHNIHGRADQVNELAISVYGKVPYEVLASGCLVRLDSEVLGKDVFSVEENLDVFVTSHDGHTLYCYGGPVALAGGDATSINYYIEAYRLTKPFAFHYAGMFPNPPGPDPPCDMALGLNGKYAYVLTERIQPPLKSTIVGFRCERNGVIYRLHSPVVSVAQPSAISSSPRGDFVYVLEYPTKKILVFKVTASGKLSATNATGFSLPLTPSDIIIPPGGSFFYVICRDRNAIMLEHISKSGSLSQPTIISFDQTTSQPTMAISPNGRFLYAVQSAPYRTSEFEIRPDGTLKPLSPASIPVLPYHISIDLSGRFAYLSMNTKVIRQYKISPTGQLLPLKVPVIPAPSDEAVYLKFMQP